MPPTTEPFGMRYVPDAWRVLHARAKNATGRGLTELQKGEPRIVVSEADIGNPGASLFAAALKENKGVQNLNLSGNRIENEGACQLAQALQGCDKLVVLCLTNNRIGDEGAKEIARLVEKHRTLRLLNLDGNAITDIGAQLLLGALASNPRGKDICVALTSNPVKRLSTKSLENLAIAAETVKSLSTRGMKLGSLLGLYAAGCADGTIEPETTTTSDVVLDIVMPASAPARQSYVEAFGKDNPRPGSFVIHAWNGLFRDLLRAIASHATRDPNPSLDLNDPIWVFDAFGYKDRSYFIDVFCVNQHATLNQNRRYGLPDPSTFQLGDAYCQIDKFSQIAGQIQRRNGRILVVVDYDNLVLSRILCLKEVHEAISADTSKVDVSFCRLPSYPYDKMFTPVQNCKASCTSDMDTTLQAIEDDCGGSHQFDKEIVEFMTSSISAKYQEKIQALMPKEYMGIKASDNN
jgi:hypothetical protein